MPNHAGYAAVIDLRQEKMQEIIRIFYHVSQIPHVLRGSGLGLAVDFFLDLPSIAFSAGHADAFILNLRAWGPLTVTRGSVTQTRRVVFTARILLPHHLTLNSGNLIIGFNGGAAILDTMNIVEFEGGAFSPETRAYIDSSEFKTLVQLMLRLQLSSLLRSAPFSLSMLGQIATDPGTTVTGRAGNGLLMVGLDTNISGYTTRGDPGQLIDFTDSMHLAITINPVVLDLMMSEARRSIEETIAEQEATLNSLAFSLREGAIHITGSASKTGGSVSFAMDAVPRLIRPGIHEEWEEEYGGHFEYTSPAREELWFEIQNMSVDVHRDWWVYLVEVLGGIITIGIGVCIVEAMVDMIRSNVSGGVTASEDRSMSNRNQVFTLPGIPQPTIRMRLERYSCHSDGMFIGILLMPQFPAPSLSGRSYIAIRELVATTTSLNYAVQIPFDLQPDDPQLRIRWTVRRLDTNEILLNTDGPAIGLQNISLADLRSALSLATGCRIECRVYQTIGAAITDFYNASLTLNIYDRLDRSHPFVRWSHTVFTPVVRVETDGSHTYLGYDSITRHSDLHRTDCPGRCIMVSCFSSNVLPAPVPGRHLPVLEYLDALPFPRTREQIIAHRHQLCDYCFFGGPDKTEPQI